MGNPATEVNSPAFSEETLIATGNATRSALQQVIPTTEDPNDTMQSCCRQRSSQNYNKNLECSQTSPTSDQSPKRPKPAGVVEKFQSSSAAFMSIVGTI